MKNNKENKKSWVPVILIGLFIVIMIGCVYGWLYTGFNRHKCYSPIKKIVETHKLYSIQNAVQKEGTLHGATYAMVGFINGSEDNAEYVYTYEETDEHTMKMHKYSYDDIEFKFISENETPYIETYLYIKVDTLIYKHDNKITLDTLYYTQNGFSDYQYDLNFCIYKYIICIPENTILNTYDLNLKNLQ